MPTKAQIEAENEALKADLLIIAQRIRNEAIARSWCSDYENVMEQINSQTSTTHMLPCSIEHTVTVEGRIDLPFSELTLAIATSQSEPTAEEVQQAVRDWVRENLVSIYVIDTPSLDSITIRERS